jgi:Putative  PD-(D/E)XK family member, (DUF4420)
MTMKIETIWETLENDPTFNGRLVCKRYSASINADILVGIKGDNKQRWIGIGCPKGTTVDAARFDKLKDVKVDIRANPSVSNPLLFTISLENKLLTDIFSIVCEDLITGVASLTESAVILRGILKRLEKWQLLFEKYHNGSLSPEVQQGLYGELSFLRKLIQESTDIAVCLNSWVGTTAYFHDFHWHSWAIEVKTSSPRAQTKLRISSVEQLDDKGLAFLGLCHYVLDTQTNKGETLNQIVNELSELFYSKSSSLGNQFKSKLLEVGYFTVHQPFYETTHYNLINTTYYKIEENFPRLIPSSMPLGIEEVKYSINLNQCQPYQINELDLFKMMS